MGSVGEVGDEVLPLAVRFAEGIAGVVGKWKSTGL